MVTNRTAIPIEIAIKLLDCNFYKDDENDKFIEYHSMLEKYNSAIKDDKIIPKIPSIYDVIDWVYDRHGLHIYVEFDMPYSAYAVNQTRGFKVHCIDTTVSTRYDAPKFKIDTVFSTKEEAYITALTKLFTEFDMSYHGLPLPKKEVEVEGAKLVLSDNPIEISTEEKETITV